MTAARSGLRSMSAVALIGMLIGATAACGTEDARDGSTWEEPSSYAYTLKSTEGERSLLGTFRVTVRDGKVAEAVGLDESGRRVAKQLPGEVPTIGELLEELEQARHDRADTAEAKYASDGHPLRISLDRDKNALDDEALYVISAYEPSGR
ncbi:DUF6174 domain-containing protein [Streptomyces sp. NPDC046853]|uniref:DUF6174 domain-containing protein n=1 Tax=Streptomyces sp. NPDC046853 TaxID=3154920 RepID=UPI0033CC8FFA